jgi:hypothetical protein
MFDLFVGVSSLVNRRARGIKSILADGPILRADQIDLGSGTKKLGNINIVI